LLGSGLPWVGWGGGGGKAGVKTWAAKLNTRINGSAMRTT
jgi:hypothetical protein